MVGERAHTSHKRSHGLCRLSRHPLFSRSAQLYIFCGNHEFRDFAGAPTHDGAAQGNKDMASRLILDITMAAGMISVMRVL